MTKEKNNDTFRYVVTPFRFTGAVITSMSDGIHNDYDKGETLDMLRERYKNPWLFTVTVEEIHAMINKYEELYKQRRKFSRMLKRTEGRIRKRPGGSTRLPRKEKKRNCGRHRNGLVRLLENALIDMGYEYDMIHEFFCHHYKGRLKMNPAKQLFIAWYYENEKD